MNLAEYLKNGNLFLILSELNNPKLNLFEKYKPDFLNTLFLIKYGSKTLNSNFNIISLENLGNIIHYQYFDSWNKLEIELININDLSDNSKTVIRELSENLNVSDNQDSSNSVAAMNTDELIEESGNKINQLRDSSKKGNETIRTLNYNKLSATNNISTFNELNILDVFLNDIKNLISLSIYE